MTDKHDFRLNSLGSLTGVKTVSRYSAQELARFQEQFKPLAETYNAKLRTGLKLLAFCLLCVVPFCVSIAYNFAYGFWLFGAVIALCLTCMAYSMVTAKIRCTACQVDLDSGLGAYCPECGGELRHEANSKEEAQCLACGARPRFMRQSRGGRVRAFKIKSCSYCGVRLHESGV